MKITALSVTTMFVAVLFPSFAAQAQPAPLSNPVVERMPCRVASSDQIAGETRGARPVRMRYDTADTRYQASARKTSARYVVPSTPSGDRLDIVAELRGACE